jgi:hypothetical protein
MTAKVCAAFVAAQADLRNPSKDKFANAGKFGYKYTDIASILDLVRPILFKHGLAVSQDVSMEDNKLLIRTKIIHSSGEMLEFGPLGGSIGETWQTTGSGITYARRYALQAALGIAADIDDNPPDRDDDGASASPPVGRSTSATKWIEAMQAAVAAEDADSLAELHDAIKKAGDLGLQYQSLTLQQWIERAQQKVAEK